MLDASSFSRSFPLLLVMVLALLAGCRTYGDYGSEEATLEQIREVRRLQADEARRARADFDVLTEAAAGDPALRPYAAQYELLLERQAAVLARNEYAAEHVDEGNYRDLHRTYGAIISRQRTLRQQYDELLREIAYGNRPIPEVRRGDVEEGRYAAVPTYYKRVESEANRLTMREALRARDEASQNPAQSGPPVTVQERVPGPTGADAVQPEASPAQEPASGPDSSAADFSAADSSAADSSAADSSAADSLGN